MTTQTDDTRRILDMLSQGTITVDEADRLIKAMCPDQPAESAKADAAAGGGKPMKSTTARSRCGIPVSSGQTPNFFAWSEVMP